MTSPPPGMFSRRSIRTQLVFWNILALTLLLGLLGLVIHYTVVSTILASIDHELEMRTGGPAGGIPPPPSGPPPPGPPGAGFGPGEPPGFGERNGPHIDPNPFRPRRFPLSDDLSGSFGGDIPWDTNGLARAQHGETVYSTLTAGGEPLRVLSRPYPESGPVQGVVQAAYPLTDAERAIAGLNRVLLTLIPFALLCAGAGGAYLTGRVLGRVRRMTQAAGQIGTQDLSRRLPTVGSDEFSELAETFNGLLGRLETAFRQQERLIEQQRRFTADASHELKTPLTIIRGNTSMTLSGRPSEAGYRESLQEIDRAAETMSHLVQDLLLLARSDGGQLGRGRIELLMREVLERAITQVSREGAAPITLAMADESLSVLGNETELVRLFSNLLENAVQSTPPDGRITVTASRDGDRAVVQVLDTGTGIAPEHLPHLGERFFRVDSARSRQEGGTGLGLSICKSLVEAHQGTMTIRSAPGAGTSVTVTLPGIGRFTGTGPDPIAASGSRRV